MQMGMRRFTRLTNGFSGKVENLAQAVSLHCTHYDFARPHQSLTVKTASDTAKRTPAMAGVRPDLIAHRHRGPAGLTTRTLAGCESRMTLRLMRPTST